MHATLPHARRSTGRLRPSHRRTSLVSALMVTALLLAACGAEPDAPAVPGVPDTTTPAPAPAPDVDAPEPDEAPEPEERLLVYLVRSGPTDFFVEPVAVPLDEVDAAGAAGATVGERITASIAALLALTTPQDVDLFTSVPSGTTLRDVSVAEGVVTIDLSGGIVGSSGSSSQEMTFAQQLAHTASVDASVLGVLLAIDGTPVSELWGHLDWSVPIEADPFALSPITIAVPPAGTTVTAGAFTFRGEATVFEATLLVTLFGEDGDVIAEDFLTATVGGPERGTWEWTVTLPGAGLYTLLAEESDPSDGEGRPPFATTRTLRAVE